ncbi:unnamed protein product [Ectocarpus sp. 12 AP-2014]
MIVSIQQPLTVHEGSRLRGPNQASVVCIMCIRTVGFVQIFVGVLEDSDITPFFGFACYEILRKCTGKKERVPSLTAAVRECMLTGVNRAAVSCASMFSLRPKVSATGMVGSNTRRSRRPVAGAPKQPAASFRGHRCPRSAQFARTQDMPSRGCPAERRDGEYPNEDKHLHQRCGR